MEQFDMANVSFAMLANITNVARPPEVDIVETTLT